MCRWIIKNFQTAKTLERVAPPSAVIYLGSHGMTILTIVHNIDADILLLFNHLICFISNNLSKLLVAQLALRMCFISSKQAVGTWKRSNVSSTNTCHVFLPSRSRTDAMFFILRQSRVKRSSFSKVRYS